MVGRGFGFVGQARGMGFVFEGDQISALLFFILRGNLEETQQVLNLLQQPLIETKKQ